jgi:DNA-binding MarR family transcriptional regulator
VEYSKNYVPARIGKEDLVKQGGLVRENLGSLAQLVERLAGASRPVHQGQPITEGAIRALLKCRRNRDQFFVPELFADPAWDILLELYAAELGQQRVSVGGLCLGASVPATTALRWIGRLEMLGLIARTQDPMDGRRFFMCLTQDGIDAMEGYFRTVPCGVPTV